MAICDEIPGLKVYVVVAGKDATEYDDEDGPQEDKNETNALNRVFKFIESQDDAVFSVRFSLGPPHRFESDTGRLLCEVYVDGHRMDGRFLGGPWPTYHCKGALSRHQKTGRCEMQPCKFAGITTVDTVEPGRVKKDVQSAKSVGLVQVRVSRHELLRPVDSWRGVTTAKSSSCELAEKAVKGKAVSHGLLLGSPVRVDAPQTMSSRSLDNERPFVTFDFKYRSRESLQKLLIIPRAPSPDLEEEIDNLSEEALRDLARQQLRRNRAASTDTIKAEDGSIIKREIGEVFDLTGDTPQGGRKRKRVETIDLTDD